MEDEMYKYLQDNVEEFMKTASLHDHPNVQDVGSIIGSFVSKLDKRLAGKEYELRITYNVEELHRNENNLFTVYYVFSDKKLNFKAAYKSIFRIDISYKTVHVEMAQDIAVVNEIDEKDLEYLKKHSIFNFN